MDREQAAVELGRARNTRRESEKSRKVNIQDLAKLARAVGAVMIGLGVPFGPMLPDRLVEEVERLPGVIKECELSTARRVVHRVLAMFKSHYQGLDCMALSDGWAPGISDAQCDELELRHLHPRQGRRRLEGPEPAARRCTRRPGKLQAFSLDVSS
jgi:hypothetical protein